jgi:hypothetical protein
MGFFEMLGFGKQSHHNKRIHELEKRVGQLERQLIDSGTKIHELSNLASYSINSQKQLALDMNTIYESLMAVSETLHASAPSADDERYFKWRWNTGNDDDDLPN